MLRTNRRPAAAYYRRRASIFQFGAGPAADVIKIIMAPDLDQAGHAERFDHFRDQRFRGSNGRIDLHETRPAHGGVRHRQRRFFHDLLDLRRREIGIGRQQQCGNAGQAGRRSRSAIKIAEPARNRRGDIVNAGDRNRVEHVRRRQRGAVVCKQQLGSGSG